MLMQTWEYKLLGLGLIMGIIYPFSFFGISYRISVVHHETRISPQEFRSMSCLRELSQVERL